jgi:hypothetical protein
MLTSDFRKSLNKIANGDGSKTYAIKLIKSLTSASKILEHRYEYDNCIKQYGREIVALCTASTILNASGYENDQIQWANDIINVWKNHTSERSMYSALINIHPAILADNSYTLRYETTERNK